MYQFVNRIPYKSIAVMSAQPKEGVSYVTNMLCDESFRKYYEQCEQVHLAEVAHMARVHLVGELGSSIAHEVNQPLTAIANYTQACLCLLETESPDLVKLSDVLLKTHQQALKAGQIIKGIKALVSSQQKVRSYAAVNTLIQNVVSLCRNDLNSHQIALGLDLSDNLPDILLDEIQIEQVLLNLLRNSIDALQEILGKPRQLRIQTRINNNQEIQVSVHDNGSGIKEAKKHKILAPFFTTKATGMGIGLSISRSIIKAHQGDLNFSSQADEGTCFYFLLPVKLLAERGLQAHP